MISFLTEALPRPYQSLGAQMRSLRICDGEKEDLLHPARRFQGDVKRGIRAIRLQSSSTRGINVRLGFTDQKFAADVSVEVCAEDCALAWDAFVYGVLVPSVASSIISVDFVDYLELLRRFPKISIKVELGGKAIGAGNHESGFDRPIFVTAWIPTSWTEAEILHLLREQARATSVEPFAILPHQGNSLILITGYAYQTKSSGTSNCA